MEPTVAILVPSYNHARFLGAALDSVIAQTVPHWELVVLDDGSTDDSVAVARATTDARIRTEVNPQNLGTYGTLQRALEMTTAPWVAVLNSDDLWRPTKLERQLAVAEGASAVATLGEFVDDEGRIMPGDPHGDWPLEGWTAKLAAENRILASSVLFRREGLRFRSDHRYSGDWMALLDASERGPLQLVPERLVGWRLHGRNTHLRSEAQVAEEIRVREFIRQAGLGDRASKAEGLRHLAALRAMRGETGEAVSAAMAALKEDRSRASLRRLVGVLLPGARRRMGG